jgi:hypothetical protein
MTVNNDRAGADDANAKRGGHTCSFLLSDAAQAQLANGLPLRRVRTTSRLSYHEAIDLMTTYSLSSYSPHTMVWCHLPVVSPVGIG